MAQYVSKNAAPRSVYESKLVGQLQEVSHLESVQRLGSFTTSELDVFDVLIVDEAHRLNEKSGLYQNLGENQIKELIIAARLSACSSSTRISASR